jgi:hypothetical protein
MDWKSISFVPPTLAPTGKMWIKPLDGEAASVYRKFGDEWVFLCSAPDIVVNVGPVIVLVNGHDWTSYVQQGTVAPVDSLTKLVDTCDFVINDLDGNHKPIEGMEVHVFRQVSPGTDPVLWFGGNIVSAPQGRLVYGKYQYAVSCNDHSMALQKRLVNGTYDNMTAGEIATAIIRDYAPELGTAFIDDGPLISLISFSYQYPDQCLNTLCEKTGMDFYVDPEKNVHMFTYETNIAPYELNEDSSGGTYRDLVIVPDISQLRNRIIVRGGYELSQLYTEDTRLAFANQTAFDLKHVPFAPVSFYVNGVLKTLGVENIDRSGVDFIVNQSNKVIKCLDHAPLSNTDTYYATYKYQLPIFCQVDDEESIANMKAITEGDGVYEFVIVDQTIETKAAAKMRAIAEKDMYGNPLVAGSFITSQWGYHSGQVLTINLPSRNINTSVLVQRVSAQDMGAGIFEFTVEFATKLKGLTSFLLYLFDNGKKVFDRTDEILTLFKITKDSVTVTDSVPIPSLRDVDSNPFVYSADDESTPNRGRYNLAIYG